MIQGGFIRVLRANRGGFEIGRWSKPQLGLNRRGSLRPAHRRLSLQETVKGRGDGETDGAQPPLCG